jgi:hypothetical protein
MAAAQRARVLLRSTSGSNTVRVCAHACACCVDAPTHRILEERCVSVTWPADAAEGGGCGGQQQTLGCFKAPSNNSGETSGLGRHPFFRLRRMQNVAAF